MDIHFMLWDNPVLSISLFRLSPSRPLGALRVAPLSLTCLLFVDIFGTTGSCRFSGIFSGPALGSAIAPGSPGSSYWRILLESKVWALGVLVAPGVSLLLGPLGGQSQGIPVGTNPCTYTHVCTCVHVRPAASLLSYT